MPPRAARLPLLIIQGDWHEARDLALVTRAQGSPLERHMAVTVLGILAHQQGDPDQAWSMVRELLPRGPMSEPGEALFPYAMDTLRLAVRLALDEKDAESAREWLATHDRWLQWSDAVRGRAESKLLWAKLHACEGDESAAEHCAQEALQLASDPRQPLVLLTIHRFIGRLSAAARQYDDAEEHLAHARSLAETCEVPYERARTLLAQADLYRLTGRAQDARTLLQDVRDIASRLRATPLIAAVADAEARMGPPSVEHELTPREVEVLRLVARGMTDAEVAEELFISPRTVGQHLRSVYNKLGVSSRTAATRRAIEEQII